MSGAFLVIAHEPGGARRRIAAVDARSADMTAMGMRAMGYAGPVEVRPVSRSVLGLEAGLIPADHPDMWSTARLVDLFNEREGVA